MNDNSKRKVAFALAFMVVLVVPLIFFFIFGLKEHPPILTEEVLPIYGPKKALAHDDRVDTIYHTIPDYSFVAQTGDTILSKYVKGKVLIADFFFTTCPTICVDMTRNMRKLQDEFREDGNIMLLSYTVDPATDSVPQLYDYAIKNSIDSKKWLLLTGEKKKIYDLARYGYFVTALQGDGGPNDFIHTEKLILIDKEGRIRGYYDGTSDEAVEKLMSDIKLLLASYYVIRKQS